jgi:hypothetical protein
MPENGSMRAKSEGVRIRPPLNPIAVPSLSLVSITIHGFVHYDNGRPFSRTFPENEPSEA